jgi:hypothetical protein
MSLYITRDNKMYKKIETPKDKFGCNLCTLSVCEELCLGCNNARFYFARVLPIERLLNEI